MPSLRRLALVAVPLGFAAAAPASAHAGDAAYQQASDAQIACAQRLVATLSGLDAAEACAARSVALTSALGPAEVRDDIAQVVKVARSQDAVLRWVGGVAPKASAPVQPRLALLALGALRRRSQVAGQVADAAAGASSTIGADIAARLATVGSDDPTIAPGVVNAAAAMPAVSASLEENGDADLDRLRRLPTPAGTLAAAAKRRAAARAALARELDAAPVSRSAPGAVGPQLSWAPPSSRAVTTIRMTERRRSLYLDDTKDYRIELGDTPVRGNVTITGGHDVVIVGGAIDLPTTTRGQSGLYIRRQSAGGTIHVEGVRFSGSIVDAIDLEQPNDTTVQIQNVLVDGLSTADETRWDLHPDLIQTWSGPDVLRVDRLTGYTPYQGIFLEPDDTYWRGPSNIPSLADLRNVNVRVRPGLQRTASVPMWQSTPFPLRLSNVWAEQGTRSAQTMCWPNCAAWSGLGLGVPAQGDFVAPGQVGVGYISPGYATGG